MKTPKEPQLRRFAQLTFMNLKGYYKMTKIETKNFSSEELYEIRSLPQKIIIENEYTRWVHDLEQGGELTEATVKNGSNQNLLKGAQRSVIGIIVQGKYHLFSSEKKPVKSVKIKEQDGSPLIEVEQVLADENGKILNGLDIVHSISYHPSGYGLHRVNFRINKKIKNIGQLQVGSFSTDYSFEKYQLLETLIRSRNNTAKNWSSLFQGKHYNDFPVEYNSTLPLGILMIKPGLEGIEWTMGDNISAWEGIGRKNHVWQMLHMAYSKEIQGYNVIICPLDANFEGQYIEGNHSFEFKMALPFVKKNILPFRNAAPVFNNKGHDRETRWPSEETFKKWKESFYSLMLIINDGDCNKDGIFWRDASYPPYPDDEMKRMDKFLKLADEKGVNIVPYFSAKEFHPEAKGFTEYAKSWMRTKEPEGEMIHNRPHYPSNGEFGALMCLHSGWYKKRTETIQQVLNNHMFKGVYYDFCAGYECYTPDHISKGLKHWDRHKMQQLLEWSHEQVGKNGEIYLHLTNVPNLPAENLATMIITEENWQDNIYPEMFTPHVHFMNVVPRQVCERLRPGASDTDRKKLAMCALLYHATVCSAHPVYLDFYKKELDFDPTVYLRHSAPGEGTAITSDSMIGIGVYWNENTILAILANLKEEKTKVQWKINSDRLSGSWLGKDDLTGELSIDPLEVKKIKLTCF